MLGESWRAFKSDKELRRFFFGRPAGFVGVPSATELRVDTWRWLLPGREGGPSLEPSRGDPSKKASRSRETGREEGGSIRVSMSVDLDLTNEAIDSEAFDRLAGCEGLSVVVLLLLLKVRHTEATFDSEDSDLLFSRLKFPNPNRLRRDEALELREPVLTDRVRFKESDEVAPLAAAVFTNESHQLECLEADSEHSYHQTGSHNHLRRDQARLYTHEGCPPKPMSLRSLR